MGPVGRVVRRLYPTLRLILYSPIFLVSVLRCMPRESAVLVRLPSARPRTHVMKRFSNSWTASSNWTPRSTISSTSRWRRSEIIEPDRSSSNDVARLVQSAAGQAKVRFDVLLPRLLDDVGRERGHRRPLVPADALEIIANELLVE